ncbi:pantoate--beta-alanine ligase [Aliikangiella maris]|uniref:Pantoate--beta-alanine ligase n=2 Tax=Aliikangiella maris TaxID=3162458 RepID=A0ABV3MM46_9GAMM
MKTIHSPEVLQTELLALKQKGLRIGFVPTMGNLHQGHLSLVQLAKEKADIVVVSIFVNPMQFGPNEDFDSYPRTLIDDSNKLENLGIDYLFLPEINSIYPLGQEQHTTVSLPRYTDKLCGKSRPGHFSGVTTVVNILFNIVQPNLAIFGKKDFQQLLIIRSMVKDLIMPIEIIGGEIFRESNGLAMSSRNGYLSIEEKTQASMLRKIILDAGNQITSRSQPLLTIVNQAKQQLMDAGFKVDYFEIVRQDDIATPKDSDQHLLIAAAAWLGKPRLIDNLEVTRQ